MLVDKRFDSSNRDGRRVTPPVYETDALPLSYAGLKRSYYCTIWLVIAAARAEKTSTAFHFTTSGPYVSSGTRLATARHNKFEIQGGCYEKTCLFRFDHSDHEFNSCGFPENDRRLGSPQSAARWKQAVSQTQKWKENRKAG